MLYYLPSYNIYNYIKQGMPRRIVCGLKNRESTSRHMKNLHWLKVKERIEFKVLLLVYKTLTGFSPEYATTLINYNHISGSRAPSLSPSLIKTSNGKRAFQHFAPILSNNLPSEIKCIQCATGSKILTEPEPDRITSQKKLTGFGRILTGFLKL